MWPAKGRWVATLAMLICSTLIPFPYLFPGLVSVTGALPVEALTAESSSKFERTFGAWGFAGSREFLVQGAGLGVIKGEIPEPDAAILSWLSPHEAVADLSEQPDPMLLRLHFHPGWSAGERAKLTRGPVGWTEVTGPEQAGPALGRTLGRNCLAAPGKSTQQIRLAGHCGRISVLCLSPAARWLERRKTR